MAINDMPSATIGITAFNCEHTLHRAVGSALEQNYPNTDILIVDDCSTDKTFAIAVELANSHERIRVIRTKKNSGVAASRNMIIDNTNSDFVVFFDDDDVSAPSRIREQIKHIRSCEKGNEKKLVICHTARIVSYSEEKSRYEKALAQDAGPAGITGSIISKAILCGTNQSELKGACPTCSQMARTTTYRELDGFDEDLRRSEDTDFSVRAAECGATFIGVKEPLVNQIMTVGCDKNLKIEKENWLYLLGKHRMTIERRMDFRFAVSWLELRHEWLGKEYAAFLLRSLILMTTFPLQTLKKVYFAMPNLRMHAAMSKFFADSERQT